MGDGIIKLNLGCGKKKWGGYVNVDLPGNWSGHKPDVESDLRKLPFPDDYADEAYAIHVLEHFHLWEVPEILKEWKRVLKPKGRLVIEVPCLEKILYWFTQKPLIPRMTWWGLYGDPGYKNPDMVHKWCYAKDMLVFHLDLAGFEDIQILEPEYHLKQRDMRAEAWKGGE